MSWPRILVPALESDSFPPQALLFRVPPTPEELRSMVRIAPGGAPAPLNLPAKLDAAKPSAWLYLEVVGLRGDWVRVRLRYGNLCGRSEPALGTGWVRLVDDRGRTHLRRLGDELVACGL